MPSPTGRAPSTTPSRSDPGGRGNGEAGAGRSVLVGGPLLVSGAAPLDLRGPGGLDDLADYSLPLWPTARRFESGSVPPLLVAGFEAALELLDRVGHARIRERVFSLAQRLDAGLRDRGFPVLTPSCREARAGITTFEVPDSGPVVAGLRRAGVIVAAREGRVRVSTHFYNDENDLNRLFEALPPPDGPP